MSISLNHSLAKKILLREVSNARDGITCTMVESWRERVEELGELCPPRKSSTTIAALGTALLAKATNDEVDVYSLLDRGDSDRSYSARSLADGVWAKQRAELEIDLGANGPNPLNNTPFIGKTRIDEISGVRNQTGWQYFMKCMAAVEDLNSSDEARLALRGFILARTKSLLAPISVSAGQGDSLTPSSLVDLIRRFVSGKSEGGRRAQACALAILDGVFGADRVLAGKINDPDRKSPMDISVRNIGGEGFSLAVEVKDKPIDGSVVVSSIEKMVRDHGRINVIFLAVSDQQVEKNFDAQSKWANQYGVTFTIYYDWDAFFTACKSFAPLATTVFEGTIFRRLLQRGYELEVDRDELEGLI